jgi:hypothetical protein
LGGVIPAAFLLVIFTLLNVGVLSTIVNVGVVVILPKFTVPVLEKLPPTTSSITVAAEVYAGCGVKFKTPLLVTVPLFVKFP